MLRRNSSHRLSRSKSTSSTQSKHESIDPEVARHHAQTAATLAFTRAQERNKTDVSDSGGLSRSNTADHSRQNCQSLSSQTSAAGNGDRTVKRQLSVRFVGPNGVGVKRSQSIATRATQSTVQPSISSGTLRPMAMTTNAPVPAVYRPPSRSSSIGKASGRGGAASVVTGNAFDEYYTCEDDVFSTPSSYRRLRRSKSMFSPLKAPSVFYSNGSPTRPESSYLGLLSTYSRTPQGGPPRAALRAPKSMSFLRSNSQATQERNDAVVQMARDKFFHETTQQTFREQPSFIFRSKAQRQEKPFRRSVRSSSSTNGYGMPVASSNQSSAKESTLKDAARKASNNIKKKLRKVFGRSKDDPVAIPNQQVEARETHVRQYNGEADTPQEDFLNIPHPNRPSLSRVASRIPSLHAVDSNQQLSSHAGSVKSFRSDQENDDDKSRVTSWNSTAVNTVTSQGARVLVERENQRLSIINENGTHHPSSSFTRQRLANQFSAYPIVNRPSKSTSHVSSSKNGVVDSARVYSALMKRLDENSPKSRMDASRRASFESLVAGGGVRQRSASVSSNFGNGTPATIRQVPPSESSRSQLGNHEHQWVRSDSIHSAQAEEVFGVTGPHVHQWVQADPLREARMRSEDDVFSPRDPKVITTQIAKHPNYQQLIKGNSGSPPDGMSREASTKTSYHTVPENVGLTPQEIAIRNEPSVTGSKMLRETKSTFFGGSSFAISRTTSPFRRAMIGGEYVTSALPGGVTVSTQIRNPLYLAPSESNSSAEVVGRENQQPKTTYNDSIYSRSTSGQAPAATGSALSLLPGDVPISENPPTDGGSGDVIIIDTRTYRSAMPNQNNHRATSSAGSTEWKTWMSSEVAKLERAKENINTGYINYALPTMPKSFNVGHIRENAQITDDDEVPSRKPSIAKQPLGLVSQNPNIQAQSNGQLLKPILKNRSAVSLVESIEVKPPSAIPVPPPPPPVPVHSSLRTMQSKSSLRSIATNNTTRGGSAPNSAIKNSSLSGRNILHKRNVSQATLRSTKSRSIRSIETPAKLVRRNGRPSTANTPSSAGALSYTDKQYGSSSTNSRYRTPGSGMTRANVEEHDDIYGTDGTGMMGHRTSVSEHEAQVMGSKKMVEMFLSSRRRRIASNASGEGGVFI